MTDYLKPLPIPIIKTDDPAVALQIIKDLNERLNPLKQFDETIPLDMFVLPLMDYWPLHRIRSPSIFKLDDCP